MGRRVRVVLAVLVVLVGALLARRASQPEADIPEAAAPRATSANEGGLPAELQASRWSAPVAPRGQLSVSGVVLREGQPVAGAVVTALKAHGDDVLSDLPCQCDNQCGQMLLACGCAEAAGQLVELVAARTGEGAPLGRATTDARGEFTIAGLEPTPLTLWADAPGGIAWRTDVPSDATAVKLELAAGRLISGKVRKTDGTPAAGALVTAIFAEQSRFFDAVADPQGAFRVGPVPRGKYAVVAMAAGLLPDHHTLSAEDDSPLALELSIPRTLRGTVVRGDAPAAFATVKLEGMHRKRTITADAQGAFQLDRLRPGEYALEASSADSFATAETTVSKREDRSGVILSLARGSALRGVVLDERGVAVEGARIGLSGQGSARRAVSDAKGAFSFAAVAAGKHEVSASKPGHLSAEVDTSAAEVTLTLAHAAVLSGSVRGPDGLVVAKFHVSASRHQDPDGGEPLEGLDDDALEVAGDSESVSSTDGGFALDLRPGRFDLRVQAAQFAPALLEATAPGTVSVVLSAGAQVRGLVLDPDGAPAPGAHVSVPLAGVNRGATSDLEGRFVLEGLAPGRQKIVALMRGDDGPSWTAEAEVNLAAGATAEVTLRPRQGALVAGTVITSTGEPAAGARVSGWATAPARGVEPIGYATATTDAEGHFRFRTLPPGPINLSATAKAGGAASFARTQAPDERVILKLPAATSISGRVVDEQGKPISSFKVSQRPFDTEDGRFEVPMSPGKSGFAIDAEGFAQLIREVDVKAGSNPLGDLALSRGKPVTGVVTDAKTQLPVEGALVDVGVAEPTGRERLSESRGAVRSDASGRYTLPAVDPSSRWLLVTHPKFLGKSRPLTPTLRSVDVALEHGLGFAVRLLDARGLPVRGARVLASANGVMIVLQGDGRGTYTAESAPPGHLVVFVQAEAKNFRPRELELTRDGEQLELAEATDGATVSIALVDEAEALVLVPGKVPAPSSLADLRSGTPTYLVGGVARNVLPGTWTLFAFRRAAGSEVAAVTIEVTAEPAQQFRLAPQWRPFAAE